MSTASQIKRSPTISRVTGASHGASQLFPLWYLGLNDIQCSTLRFTAEASNHFSIAKKKGGILHDAFGRVLEQVSPQAFQALWYPQFDTQEFSQFSAAASPKAFALNPPRDKCREYQQGQKFYFELCLFGKAAQFARESLRTFHQIGENGLGRQIAKFRIIECKTHTPPQFDVSHYQTSNYSGTLDLALKFISPAYFKCKGQRIFCAPSFIYLLSRAIYRANWMSVCSGRNTLIDSATRTQLLSSVENVTIESQQTSQEKWHRYSVSRKKWMCFDGVVGVVTYHNVPAQLLPLFSLIEHANIGGKTSFGMGAMSITPVINVNRDNEVKSTANITTRGATHG